MPPSSSGYEPEEHQVVEHPVQLGEQRAHPDGALGDLHAEHPLDGEDDAQLVGERRQPVVAVGEHDDLPVVARLEELLRAAVHIADDRLRVLDPLAVEDEAQPQHAVRGRVLGADVEHHVGALRRAADADRGLRRGSSWRSLSYARSYATVTRYVRWGHGNGDGGTGRTGDRTRRRSRCGPGCRGGCCGCGGCSWWCGWGRWPWPLGVLLGLFAGPGLGGLRAAAARPGGVGLAVLGRNWRSWRYAERADDLLISRGVLWREETVVPYGRMQLVEVTSGPWSGTSAWPACSCTRRPRRPTRAIPGLVPEEAERLRDRLTELGEARSAGL